MADLPWQPCRGQNEPLYLQVYQRYRQAIAAGRLLPGERVPSVRSLASELGLARGTVELAYQMLVSEGYFLPRGPAGTVVSPRLPALQTPPALPAGPRTLATLPAPGSANTGPLPLQMGLPALDAFPRKTWVRLASRQLRGMNTATMAYPETGGLPVLRSAIAAYLEVSRGIVCAPQQVFVTAGYCGVLDLVCRSVLRPGDVGWFEEPGYRYARDFLTLAGMRLIPVPVDADGLDVSAGRQRADEARFAVVTPTHQSPLGVALSLPRRLALLAWARERGAWIIEDDYDSEFRYHGRPLPPLKSLDEDARVLYAGTFSKALFPGLRLAYVVVPPAQVARCQEVAAQLPGPGDVVAQATVADFMADGHFSRHLRRMRALYAVRRSWLAEALAQRCGEALKVLPQDGGLHLLAMLRGQQDDRRVAALARAQGLAVQALRDWRLEHSEQGGLLMGCANVEGAQQALALAQRLQQALTAI